MKVELCRGASDVPVMDLGSYRMVKEIPHEAWAPYRELARRAKAALDYEPKPASQRGLQSI